MSEEDRDLPESLTVEYRASLHYEGREVDEYNLTAQGAIEILSGMVGQDPSNNGEFEVIRGNQGLDGAADGTILATEWVDSGHGVFWVRGADGRIYRQQFKVVTDQAAYDSEEEFREDHPGV